MIQRKVQFGIESTKGTPVAATRIANGVLSDPNLNRNLVWSNVQNGTYLGRQKASYPRFMPTWSYTEAASYEDLAWWLQLAVDGSVTPSADAGTPIAYTREYDPDLATDTLKSVTMEYGVDGEQVNEVAQVMVNSLTLRCNPDNQNEPAWMMDAELLGLSIDDSASFTSALTIRDTEEIAAAGTKIYIDDDPTDLGDTQKSGFLIDASLTINVNRHFKAFAENVTGAAPGKVGRQARTFDLQITHEFDDYAEYSNFLSATPVLRAVRLYQEGSVIHDAVRNALTIDAVGYWSSWAGSNRDGNMTAVMTLQAGLIDATYGNDYQFVLVNDLATLV
jgi:hypothetical protein